MCILRAQSSKNITINRMSAFNKRKITDLLVTFNKQEIRDFTAYVRERGKKSNIVLWKTVRTFHPKYEVKDEFVFKKIRPGQTYKDKNYRVWVSELTQLAKEFVAIEAFRQNEFLFNNTLSMALLKRRLKEMALKVLNKNDKALDECERHSSLYYDYAYQHEDIVYQGVLFLENRAFTDSLQKAIDLLDISYFIHKLKLLVTMRNRLYIKKETYDFHMEDELLAYLKAHPRTDVPLVHLYYLLLLMMRNLEAHTAFQEFLPYFKAHRSRIALEENRQLLIGGINFCLWNIQEGRMQYLAHRFELAKMIVEEKLMMVEGLISKLSFHLMVKIGIEVKAFDWTADFILSYLPKTSKLDRSLIEIYTWASLYGAKGDFTKQQEWLRQYIAPHKEFELTDEDEILFRILELKAGYEQWTPKGSDFFLARVEAFRPYISRKEAQISDNFRLSALNFAKALKQLTQKRLGKASRVGDLRTYILGLRPMRELPWLLEKIATKNIRRLRH